MTFGAGFAPHEEVSGEDDPPWQDAAPSTHSLGFWHPPACPQQHNLSNHGLALFSLNSQDSRWARQEFGPAGILWSGACILLGAPARSPAGFSPVLPWLPGYFPKL